MTATLRRLVAKEQLDDAVSETQKILDLDSDTSHNDAAREQARENLAAAEREHAEAVQAENIAIAAFQAGPTSQLASQLLSNGRYSRGKTMADYTQLVTKKRRIEQDITKTKQRLEELQVILAQVEKEIEEDGAKLIASNEARRQWMQTPLGKIKPNNDPEV